MEETESVKTKKEEMEAIQKFHAATHARLLQSAAPIPTRYVSDKSSSYATAFPFCLRDSLRQRERLYCVC